ncbi:hypothetical protein CPB84DRAFT_1721577 [Gymnopilus junonius]|uniref:Uncharacterized protein n=1 Tax=Gymnopilus junonius TaxID=109634 RepID=A0A9P5TT36_GYMJU|nr:hypothetical protein CPB84DRAFT_1721577 [Gymnopilus junonius]
MSTTTTHLAFFAPAASSFHPAPYNPASQSSSRTPVHATRNSRSHDSLALPPPGMDPQPSDPDVLFIHPPFTDFPNSHLHPDGLTYSLMAENPEWFLDAHDFISQPNPNLSGIPYPPHLEPPRGWCPAKKKDLKERGPEGWPEGEEPRLRCTFCRRTYAGVNAKSMWRRHVFEKHKIAMSNRRDGNLDRPRGRGSGKENRHHVSTKSHDEVHDSLVSMVVTPQTAPEMTSHKSRFRTVKPTQIPKRRRDRETQKQKDTDDQPPSFASSGPLQRGLTDHAEDESDHDPPAEIISPPLTPHGGISSDSTFVITSSSAEHLVKSPVLPVPVIPESPYNPLQTPAFRHSPPPLPSDQPWRFASPSHPLSTTRDISLTMLAPLASPIKTGPLGPMLAMHSSPLSSPSGAPSSSAAFETPGHSKILFPKTINRPQFIKGPVSSPLNPSRRYRESHGSPLIKKPLGTLHNRQHSDLSEAWFSEDSLAPASSSDPFYIYGSWSTVEDSPISPVRIPKGPSEPESPVLRNGTLPTVVSLGLGLLEPFTFSKEEPFNSIDADLLQPEEKVIHLDGKRSATQESDSQSNTSPPLKKRRLSKESTDV